MSVPSRGVADGRGPVVTGGKVRLAIFRGSSESHRKGEIKSRSTQRRASMSPPRGYCSETSMEWRTRTPPPQTSWLSFGGFILFPLDESGHPSATGHEDGDEVGDDQLLTTRKTARDILPQFSRQNYWLLPLRRMRKSGLRRGSPWEQPLAPFPRKVLSIIQ